MAIHSDAIIAQDATFDESHDVSIPLQPDLVWARLPNGEWTYLKPSSGPAERDDALHVLTQRGRDALARDRAIEAAFGPWPTVSAAMKLREAR